MPRRRSSSDRGKKKDMPRNTPPSARSAKAPRRYENTAGEADVSGFSRRRATKVPTRTVIKHHGTAKKHVKAR